MSSLQNIKGSHPSLKQILLGGLGGSVGIMGVIIGVAMYIVETLTRPKRLAPFALYTFSPFELGLPAEEVTFPPLYGDHRVSGWFIPCPGATSTIMISPGYRGSRSDVLGLCRPLWNAGYNVLVFEYYGHGMAVGKPVTLGYREINDFLGAVVYAKQRAPHARLGAIGYSMGAAISIIGCARTSEVEALIADSAFSTHKSAIEYAVRRTLHLPFFLFDWVTDALLWWRAGYHFNQVEPLRDIGRIAPRPILIIHGMKDSVVDPRDAPRLYEAAGNPKELWLLPEVEHCGAYFADRAAYVNKVLQFFDTYLKQSSPVEQLPEQASEKQVKGPNATWPRLPEAS
ncbi:MAG TPA: alpha/beta hydrolase [Ktedonobacteraceae bacterium]|nr:alpha/beta hydrolase [Ktedonobacteraceae bacterium]